MASPQSPANKIESAHQLYRDGKYAVALGFYTEALSMAKTNLQKISLHSNRAACYLKLHSFNKAAEECTSVLELDRDHTGALMLRAQTLVTLKDYRSALFDVNRLMELDPSSEVYQNLETRLRTQLSLASIPESEAELEEEDENESEEGEEDEDEDVGTEQTSEFQHDGNTSCAEEGLSETENIKQPSHGGGEQRSESKTSITAEVIAQAQRKAEPRKTIAAEVIEQAQKAKLLSKQQSKGWQAIPKPKGHSTLNYGRWDRVEDDSSEEEDDDEDDEESQPQFRFRVRTVGVQPVK
ncbi:Protein unc-45 homolog A [Linum perenne]